MLSLALYLCIERNCDIVEFSPGIAARCLDAKTAPHFGPPISAPYRSIQRPASVPRNAGYR